MPGPTQQPKLMQPAHGVINDLLTWAINNFGYSKVILVKDTIPTLSAVLIGIIIGIFLMSYVLKDTRMVPDPDAEDLSITSIRKNERRKLFITAPTKDASRVPLITAVTLFLIAAFMKFCPWSTKKKIQFVDSRKVRIMFVAITVIVLSICIFTIVVDFHSILPDGHGGYDIYEFKK